MGSWACHTLEPTSPVTCWIFHDRTAKGDGSSPFVQMQQYSRPSSLHTKLRRLKRACDEVFPFQEGFMFFLGLDVGLSDLYARLLHVPTQGAPVALWDVREFCNSPKGHQELCAWLWVHNAVPTLTAVVESTGVYWERRGGLPPHGWVCRECRQRRADQVLCEKYAATWQNGQDGCRVDRSVWGHYASSTLDAHRCVCRWRHREA